MVINNFDYKEEKDVLRFDVETNASDEIVEMMRFVITDAGLSFAWETISFDFTIEGILM